MIPGGIAELEAFRSDVKQVAVRRDLSTATQFGARLNNLVSRFDRHASKLPESARPLLELAHAHVRAMMNCPRRMRLDDTWQDDFVVEAIKAANALITLAHSLPDDTEGK